MLSVPFLVFRHGESDDLASLGIYPSLDHLMLVAAGFTKQKSVAAAIGR